MASMNGEQTMLKVKVIYDTDIRQWRYPPSKHYESLVAFVRASFRINTFLMQYTDDEGDRLTIASQKDLIDAYNASKEQLRRSLRIFVSEKAGATDVATNSISNHVHTQKSNEHIEFHWGSACTECKMSPIQGARYKCCICHNYNLCTTCEAKKGIHDVSHPMIKLNIYKNKLSRFGVSSQNIMFNGLNELLNHLGLTTTKQQPQGSPPNKSKTVNRRFDNVYMQSSSSPQLSAELLDHLTLKEGSECITDKIERKKWRLRNNGVTEWGYNVELVFLKGDKEMVLNKRQSVSNCKVGQVTDVQCSVKIPNASGRYVMYYRLYAGDKPFGPALSVDIIAVTQLQKQKHAHNDKKQKNDDNDGTKPKQKGRRLSMILSANIPSISCVCGEYLMVTRPSAMYGNGQIIFCIECGTRCASNESIYHCSMDRNALHPKGYDLCNKCYELRLVSAFKENEDQKENEKPKAQQVTKTYTNNNSTDVAKSKSRMRDFVNKQTTYAVSAADIEKYKPRMSELRNVFPRFYFLSDEEMFRLIKDPSPMNVGKYLHILFEGLSGFVLDEENPNIILGLRAFNGEILRFGRLINVGNKSLRGSLDKWLLKIEYQMRYSMSIKLEESFADYAVIENSEKYFEWINNYSTQIILITKRCLWCKTIEYFLTHNHHNMNLNECLNEIKAEITLLSSYVYNQLMKREQTHPVKVLKSKIGALIQQLAYQRDVTQLLIKQKVSSTNDSIWVSKMRTYYTTDDNMLDEYNIFKKLYIKCNHKRYYYGYEFYGDVTSFIYTRTINSDTLFPLLLSTTVDSSHISNVYGEIGTAKTESIKVFAYDLGRSCKVFDVSRVYDSVMLFNWFAGIASLGAFAILTPMLMRKFSGQVSYFAASISYHLKEHKNHMIVNEKRIPLHANTRIFMITKKQYKNSDSNDIMNKIVRGVAMPSSNKLSIIFVLLSANGFQAAEQLAPKCAMLLELCVTLLVTEARYDFGFKLIMKIAHKAGEALVTCMQNKVNGDKEENEQELVVLDEDIIDLNQALADNRNTSQEKEEELLANALVNAMFDMLTESDCILFESLMESAFPQNNIDWNKYATSIKKNQSTASSASTSSMSSNNSLYTNVNHVSANNNYYKYDNKHGRLW